MYPQRFFIPNYIYTYPLRTPGLFRRIFTGIRGFNWQSILTNANKTLNVVNQTIPLVRQAGPMFNNMKSMIRLAKAFGTETTNNTKKEKNTIKEIPKEKNIIIQSTNEETPNFFI